MSTPILWKRFQQHLCQVPELGLTLDLSRMRFEDGFLDRMAAPMPRALGAMDALERGAIANPDEKRWRVSRWVQGAPGGPISRNEERERVLCPGLGLGRGGCRRRVLVGEPLLAFLRGVKWPLESRPVPQAASIWEGPAERASPRLPSG
jgi:hypothetical protein